ICFKEDEKLRQKLRLRDIEGAAVKNAIKAGQWKALIWFVSCIALAMLLVISTARLPGLSNLAFPLMTVLFLAGGVGGGLFAGLGPAQLADAFRKGILNILPGVFLVLLAYSVKHIITTGMIMDTILYMAAELIRRSPPMSAAFLIYATTLGMNFFIGSASAKAFLMMPLLTPLADLVGITRQTAVLAFDFGDGFSNMIFPTNPLLLIALSFSVVSYTKWIRWTWKLQLVILILTSAFLAFAVKIGFGPF
ncbi:MAG: AbgT family transporter, partial [Treponema sp.]|nr:AbgT family transporter [Treponema sp.]